MFATRRLATSLPRVTLTRQHQPATTALFHSTRPSLVQVGDPIPDLEVLTEGTPAQKVNLAKELTTGKGIIIGTPGAFSLSLAVYIITRAMLIGYTVRSWMLPLPCTGVLDPS